MTKSVNPYVLVVVLAAGLVLTGCANFNLNLPFFSNYDVPDNPPTAKFLPKKQLPEKKIKTVMIKAPLDETINIIQDAITSVVDTTTYIQKNDADTSKNETNRSNVKVRSNTFQVDDLSRIEKYFFTGNYVLEAPYFKVKTQNGEYYVEVTISGSYNGYKVKPNIKASINWDLFEYRPEQKDTLKVPEDSEPYFGIGSHIYEIEETYINRNNKEKTFSYWEEKDIDDDPVSRGILEAKVRNKIIEYAAMRNVTAYTK